MADQLAQQYSGARARKSGWWTTIVACLGAFLDGYDLVIISGALLFIGPELHLTTAEIGLVGSIVFAGMVVGALVFGRITDRVGRNGAFVFVLLLFVIGSIVCAAAPSGWVLIIGRFIIGLGIGADLPVSTTLIAETAAAKHRGMATGFMQVFWFGGAAFSGIAGIVFYLMLGDESWRWMLGSAAVLAVIVMILRTRITESGRWVQAKSAAATQAQRPHAGAAPAKRSGLGILWRSKAMRAALLFSCLFWFAVTIRGAGFNLYTPTLIKEFGLSSVVESLWFGCLTNFIYTAAVLISLIFIDRAGRRWYVLSFWIASTALTAGLLLVAGGNAVFLFIMITISLLPIQILTATLFPMSVEAFPTLVRGSAQSLSSAAGKIGGFIVALLFPILLSGLGFPTLIVLLVGFMILVAILGITLRFPETKGIELEDVAQRYAEKA